MALTIELPPELEQRLQAAASQRGQDAASFALSIITTSMLKLEVKDTATVIPLTWMDDNDEPQLTLEEFDAALDELAAIGAGIPRIDETITHSRADIYLDHD